LRYLYVLVTIYLAYHNQSKASRHFAQPSLSRLGKKTANTKRCR